MLPDHSLGNWHWEGGREGGSEREVDGWEGEEEGGQGNTVIRSEETVAQINSEACLPPSPPTPPYRPTRYFWSTLNKHPRKDTKGHLSRTLITPLEMTGELKPPNRCRHPRALGLLVPPTSFSPLSPECLLYHPNLSARCGDEDQIWTELLRERACGRWRGYRRLSAHLQSRGLIRMK